MKILNVSCSWVDKCPRPEYFDDSKTDVKYGQFALFPRAFITPRNHRANVSLRKQSACLSRIMLRGNMTAAAGNEHCKIIVESDV